MEADQDVTKAAKTFAPKKGLSVYLKQWFKRLLNALA